MAKKVLNGLDLTGQKIVNLADPTGPADGATKQYVDNIAAGLSWKAPVRVATTTNGALATAFANGQTVDGVTLTTGMRILLKNQSAGAENGIYTVNASGAPTRATDADSTAELQNATVYVVAGTANADQAFTQTANDPTVGSTALTWAQVGGGTSYSAGDGLDLVGSTFSLDLKSGGGLAIDTTELTVDLAALRALGLAVKYAVNVPNGSTTATITHNLGTLDVTVSVHEITGGAEVECDVVKATTDTVTLTFATAPTSGQYRCIVTG